MRFISKHREEKMSSISVQLPKRRTAETSQFEASVTIRLPRLAYTPTRLSAQILMSWIAAIIYVTVVALVAAYDIVLTIRYANFLVQLEENPVGRWIMNLKHDTIYDVEATPNIVPFIVLKVFGTFLVLGVIIALIRWRSHMGHLVGLGVSSFQLGLAAYLTYC
jgi:hypothetical protein